jgi:hypothetical protein
VETIITTMNLTESEEIKNLKDGEIGVFVAYRHNGELYTNSTSGDKEELISLLETAHHLIDTTGDTVELLNERE